MTEVKYLLLALGTMSCEYFGQRWLYPTGRACVWPTCVSYRNCPWCKQSSMMQVLLRLWNYHHTADVAYPREHVLFGWFDVPSMRQDGLLYQDSIGVVDWNASGESCLP